MGAGARRREGGGGQFGKYANGRETQTRISGFLDFWIRDWGLGIRDQGLGRSSVTGISTGKSWSVRGGRGGAGKTATSFFDWDFWISGWG